MTNPVSGQDSQFWWVKVPLGVLVFGEELNAQNQTTVRLIRDGVSLPCLGAEMVMYSLNWTTYLCDQWRKALV